MIEERHIPDAVARLHPIEAPLEQPVDVGRYVNALRRSRILIAVTVVTLTGLVLVLSLALPKTYGASATILLDENPDITAAADTERQLATIQTLLTTRVVLARAARRLPGESSETLSRKIHASVDPKANIIRIRASAATAEGAARIANAVAAAFVARQRSLELRRLDAARSRLLEAMTRLRGTPGARAEIALIRERLSEISVSEASAGSELQLADAARPPTAADSPRPFRNAIFAFVAALFIGVLAALGRERLAPRLAGPRDLERLTGLTILGEIPRPKSRVGLGVSQGPREQQAYEALVPAIEAQLPTRDRQVLLVTSALPGEGKEHVTAGLSRALAQAGEATLVVDGDLRRPALEQLFGMEPAPGLAEMLIAVREGDPDAAGGMIAEPPASASGRRAAGSLAVLGAGEGSATAVVSAEALDLFFAELEQSAFTHVVIQAPPVLASTDYRHWTHRVDGVIVAARPDQLTPAAAVETRDRLQRAGAYLLGHVAVGAGRVF